MKRLPRLASAVFTAHLLTACAAAPERPANAEAAGEGEVDTQQTDSGKQKMLALLEANIETAQSKFVQLAEAIPEDRYDWRPMEGVRSFREVFIHIAVDNWAPIWADVSTPEDIPVTKDMASFSAYQAQSYTKQQAVAELKRSFEFLLSALDQTRDRLDERITVGGNEWAMDRLWVELATHMHEHLGQTVAYARANEIVPPWSR